MADAPNDTTATPNSAETTPAAQTDAAAAGGAAADAGASGGDAGGAGGSSGGGDAGGDPLDAPGILDGIEGGKEGDAATGDGAKPKEGEGTDGADGAGAGEKEGEGAEPALTGEAPEAYEIAAPEGTTIDAKAMELFEPAFRKLGLTNAGAQELVNIAPGFVDHIRGQVASGVVADVVAARKAWSDEAQADPEIGGARFEESKALAAKAFDRLGFAPDGKFRSFLKESGLGNHPEMIRAMVKMGRAIGEDGFDRGGAAKTDVPIWDRVYGAPVSPS